LQVWTEKDRKRERGRPGERVGGMGALSSHAARSKQWWWGKGHKKDRGGEYHLKWGKLIACWGQSVDGDVKYSWGGKKDTVWNHSKERKNSKATVTAGWTEIDRPDAGHGTGAVGPARNVTPSSG